MRTAPCSKTALALWAALNVAACDQSSTGPDSQPAGVQITAVSTIEPGHTATLQGSGLDALESLTVDGRTVQFRVLSDKQVEFTVPEMRACETDGRKVDVVANATRKRAGVIRVSDALQLTVGESRILSSEALQCVALPAGYEGYMLTVGNLRREVEAPAPVSLRAIGTGGGALAGPARAVGGGVPAGSGSAPDWAQGTSSLPRPRDGAQSASAPAAAPAPFDDYLHAQVGDVLEFVDWSDPEAYSVTSRDAVPTYQAQVVARSGAQMIVLDLRSPDADEMLKPDRLLTYQQAADLADRYVLDALHATVRPDVSIPRGLTIGIVMPLPADRIGEAGAWDMNPESRWASGMFVYHLATGSPMVGGLASTMIHEVAHEADFQSRTSLGTLSAGWFVEALATNVEDYAARLAHGAAENAEYDRTPPPTALTGRIAGPRTRSSEDSPFVGLGRYERGGRIVRYAAERVGGVAALYRMLADAATELRDTGEVEDTQAYADAWDIDAVAKAVRLTRDELLAQSMLADLTDDLVLPATATATGLPQLRAWSRDVDPVNRVDGPPLDRTRSTSLETSVAGGGFAAWYIDGARHDGISIKGSVPIGHQVRLTRIH